MLYLAIASAFIVGYTLGRRVGWNRGADYALAKLREAVAAEAPRFPNVDIEGQRQAGRDRRN